MKKLDGFTDQPNQRTGLLLPSGSRAELILYYRPQQRGWFYDLTWESFELYGRRLVTSPNILRQWKNVIPFGLAVITTGQAEPLNQTDLADGTTDLFLLDEADVAEVESVTFAGL